MSIELQNSIRAAGQEITKSIVAVRDTAQPKQEATEEIPEEEELETEAEAEDTEETSEEVADDESNEEESEEEATMVITWNGEDKKIPLSEIKNLAQKGFDYSQKMSQLSERAKEEGRKLVESEYEKASKATQEFMEKAELVSSLYSQPLVTQQKLQELLNEGDTEQYLQLKDREESRIRLLGQIESERKAALAKQQEEYNQKVEKIRSEQKAKFLDSKKDLEWDSFKATAIKTLGLASEEFDGLLSAKAYDIVYKAAQYDEIMKKGLPKKKAKTPNVTKKKATPPVQRTLIQKRQEQAKQQFMSKKDVRSAASYFTQILSNS